MVFMKLLFALSIFASLAVVGASAQQTSTGKASLQVQSGKKGSEKIAVPATKTPGKAEESRVSYGGALPDFAGRNKPAKTVDLRYPSKPKPAKDNVYTDPQTGAVKGFVLFAIKF